MLMVQAYNTYDPKARELARRLLAEQYGCRTKCELTVCQLLVGSRTGKQGSRRSMAAVAAPARDVQATRGAQCSSRR